MYGPGAPPKGKLYLFNLPSWEANHLIRTGKAREVNSSKRRRGIQVIERTKAHTLQEQLQQLSDWREPDQHPDLNTKGLAKLDQVEGLPVVGQAIKLFYGPTAPQFKKAA